MTDAVMRKDSEPIKNTRKTSLIGAMTGLTTLVYARFSPEDGTNPTKKQNDFIRLTGN